MPVKAQSLGYVHISKPFRKNPKVHTLGSMHVPMHMDMRKRTILGIVWFHYLLFFETVSLIGLELGDWARLSSQEVPGICMVLPPLSWDH